MFTRLLYQWEFNQVKERVYACSKMLMKPIIFIDGAVEVPMKAVVEDALSTNMEMQLDYLKLSFPKSYLEEIGVRAFTAFDQFKYRNLENLPYRLFKTREMYPNGQTMVIGENGQEITDYLFLALYVQQTVT